MKLSLNCDVESDVGETERNSAGGGMQSLDLTSKRDLALVGRAVEKWPNRWRGLDDAKKDKIVAGMDAAMNLAGELLDAEGTPERIAGAELALAVANTAVKMVTHQQKDDHHAVDAARGAGENKTENKIVVIQAPSARTMGELRKLSETPKGEP